MTAAKKIADETIEPEIEIMQIIANTVSQPGADPAVVKELRELRKDLAVEIDKRLFFAAMSRVQASISQIATDASNPQTNSRYATFAALDRAIRPHYTAEGFSVQFDDDLREGGLWVECTVTRGNWNTKHHHTVKPSTHGIKGTQMMTETHAGASALSYGKRYTYGMAFNVAVERDDDGNAAGGRVITTSQLDELMVIAAGHDTTVFCLGLTDWLGYKVENLSMVQRNDMNRVKTRLQRAIDKRKESSHD